MSTLYSVGMRLFLRLVLIAAVLCLLYPTVVLAIYSATPRENAKLYKVDAIIVLGCPTKDDGTPTPEQRERVMEGVREFQRGVSDHLIMTGAAAHNHFVEAHAMALLAEANGVPASAVIEEDHAQNTIQNIYYSDQIMEQHGWHTTEVVSSPSHLPRTAMILQHWPKLQWETHPAQWPAEYSFARRWALYWAEAMGAFRIRRQGFPPSKFMPS